MKAVGILCSFVVFCGVINTDDFSNIKVLLDITQKTSLLEIGHLLNSSAIIFISSAGEFYSFQQFFWSLSRNTADILFGVVF